CGKTGSDPGKPHRRPPSASPGGSRSSRAKTRGRKWHERSANLRRRIFRLAERERNIGGFPRADGTAEHRAALALALIGRRLVSNVLLSFAQFERELIAEVNFSQRAMFRALRS